MEQGKDITLVDLEELGRGDLAKWGIIMTGFSSRHLYRVAQNFTKAIKEIDIPDYISEYRIYGRKDDDWIMVESKDIMIHMFTEESGEDVALEFKWKHPVKEEEVEEFEKQNFALKPKWKKEGDLQIKRFKGKKEKKIL